MNEEWNQKDGSNQENIHINQTDSPERDTELNASQIDLNTNQTELNANSVNSQVEQNNQNIQGNQNIQNMQDNQNIQGNQNIQNNQSNQNNQNQEGSNYTFWTEQAKQAEGTGYQPNFQMVSSYVDNERPRTVPVEQPNNNYYNYGGQQFSNNMNPNGFAAYNNAAMPNQGDQKNGKKKGTAKKAAKIVAAAMLFGVIAGIGFQGVQFASEKLGWSTNQAVNTNFNIGGKQNSGIATTTISEGNIVTGPTDVSDVVEKTMPSIVSITSTVTQTYSYWGQSINQDVTGSGSGIIIKQNEKELLIVTNNHVIDGAKYIAVTFYGSDAKEGEVVKATVKGTDKTADLAVISVKISDMKKETLEKVKPATLGNSENVKVGEMAIAIGNSLGYGQSLTVGYISAKDRDVEVTDSESMTLLQTDAAINPGNSGGALLNKDGEVIGINSVKYADTTVEGMGFAIPISKALPIMNELEQRETLSEDEKGYIGISGDTVSEEDNQKYNMPIGVYVNQVSSDGAAKEAGILPGDIITSVNDKETKTLATLQERISSCRVGTKLTVTVMRYKEGKYQEKKIDVTLKGKDTLNALGGNQDSENTQGNQEDSQQPNDNQDSQQQNPNGKQMPSQDELDEFFDFFQDYYGN